MTLKEAIESGKKFRRTTYPSDWHSVGGDWFALQWSTTEVLADDWEVQEQPRIAYFHELANKELVVHTTYPGHTCSWCQVPEPLKPRSIKFVEVVE